MLIRHKYYSTRAHLRSTLSTSFSILALFTNQNGYWLDDTDLDTLFQDSAGNNPVTANGQAIALQLSKDRALELGQLKGNHARQTSSTFRPTKQSGGLLWRRGDRLVSTHTATPQGTIIAKFNGVDGTIIAGAQPASNGRSFLALDPNGRLSAGVGNQSRNIIFAGPDLRNETHIGAVTWDGTTVKLYLDGAEIYSAPQVGAVTGATPFMIGALNANGTAAQFWQGLIGPNIAIDRALTAAEITSITSKWSA